MSGLFIGIIAPGAIIVPVAVAFYKFKYWNRAARYFMFYIMLATVGNILAKLTAHHNNLPLLHVYTVLEFCLLCGFFRILFVNKRIRSLLLISIVAFPLLALLYVFFAHSLFIFNTLPRFLNSIILTLLCISFLIGELGREPDTIDHSFKFNLTIVVGLLIYFASCTALFGLSNYFMLQDHSRAMGNILWDIHAIFMMIMYLIFAAAYASLKKA